MQYFFPELLGIVSGLKKPLFLGGTKVRFDCFKIVERGKPSKIIPASDAPKKNFRTVYKTAIFGFWVRL